jgi:hypothetical protein
VCFSSDKWFINPPPDVSHFVRRPAPTLSIPVSDAFVRTHTPSALVAEPLSPTSRYLGATRCAFLGQCRAVKVPRCVHFLLYGADGSSSPNVPPLYMVRQAWFPERLAPRSNPTGVVRGGTICCKRTEMDASRCCRICVCNCVNSLVCSFKLTWKG